MFNCMCQAWFDPFEALSIYTLHMWYGRRKRSSYHNEATFYRNIANRMADVGLPWCYFVDEKGDDYTLMLEDLSEGFPRYIRWPSSPLLFPL